MKFRNSGPSISVSIGRMIVHNTPGGRTRSPTRRRSLRVPTPQQSWPTLLHSVVKHARSTARGCRDQDLSRDGSERRRRIDIHSPNEIRVLDP